ncbi:uncharacterized protein HMPREF1541_01251 [Cyphellophora europaea CBS 101466]|uniref:NADAR domain-containing protein n=1 Tax=Cyphellophora europaea (strain CBS 101466) TaxID=1220924 RepID=W2SEA2_CYPE1|nr:uncharacterized protein HMPREF1541_01251 [Cyphellophora europaea CBS 101466]ETN47061.1 hypothetical protein HMPREF1541_01251 [Cyphellophora europaea CBS 101466]
MSPSPERRRALSGKISPFRIQKRSSPPLNKVSQWQTFSADAGGTPAQEFRQHRLTQDSQVSESSHSKPIIVPARSLSRGTVYHENHIAFHGGILSNFHQGQRFKGAAALAYLLPKLRELNVPHPPGDTLGAHILSQHDFSCGEQFMMAMKAFLFESKDIDIVVRSFQSTVQQDTWALISRISCRDGQIHNEQLKSEQAEYARQETKLYQSNFMQILRARDPADMKNLGRQCPNFSDYLWNKANMAVVIATCLARAEHDHALANIYKDNFSEDGCSVKRGFVEGSRFDGIWGVRLDYDNKAIDDEKNWRGENRLGKCHDEACKLYNLIRSEKTLQAAQVQIKEELQNQA